MRESELQVRVTDADKRRWDREAKRNGMTRSAWVRRCLDWCCESRIGFLVTKPKGEKCKQKTN